MPEGSIFRKLDDLGRFVIPKEYRRALGIVAGDEMVIELRDGGVYARPVKSGPCPVCGHVSDAG